MSPSGSHASSMKLHQFLFVCCLYFIGDDLTMRFHLTIFFDFYAYKISTQIQIIGLLYDAYNKCRHRSVILIRKNLRRVDLHNLRG